MLRVRDFVKGHDEERWVGILNAAYGKFRDWRTVTAEEYFKEGRTSKLPFDRRWIAELDGRLAGAVHAFVQPADSRRVGYIDDLAIAPEFLGLGIEEKLAELAASWLREQGVEKMLVLRLRWADPRGKSSAEFLEKLGFNLIRQTSLMEMNLTDFPPSIAGNREVTIRPLQVFDEEDTQKLNWLRNQCSKGQFNFRPNTVEETRHLLQHNPYSYLKAFFATLNHDYVGFSVLAIDEKYNSERNVKAGIILAVGVLENHRRTGIGTKLVLHGLEVLKGEKMAKALLDVDDLNQTGALKLYERTGFAVLEKYLTYEKTSS